MDRFEDLTTARAQLYGSFLVVVVVLSGGIAGLSMLGDKLEQAAEQAEQTRNRRWIGNLVDQSVDEIPLPILNEVSDRVRFGTDALATTLYTVRRKGRAVATAIRSVAPGGIMATLLLAWPSINTAQ